jgi:uncharacterized protein (TIGR01777 family)
MQVFVTGATGFIGQRVVAELLSRGHRVTGTSRSERRSDGGDLQWVRWNPLDGATYEAALATADAVVHLAGDGVFDHRWTEARKAVLWSSRVDVTRELARTLARSPKKPSVFVSGSAVGIYGMRADDVVCTEASAQGGDFLADLAVAWEAAADPAREANVRVVHPRTGIVLDPSGGALGRMLLPFRLGVGGPLGHGAQYMSWIGMEDTVRALLFPLENASLDGGYNVTAPAPVTMAEFAKTLGQVLRRPALFPVPGPVLKLVLGSGRTDAVLTGQRAVPEKLTRAGFSFRHPTLKEALDHLLGHHP